MQFQPDSPLPELIDQAYFESEVANLLQHLRESGGAISALAKLKFAEKVIETAQGQILKSIRVQPTVKKGILEGMTYYFSNKKLIDYSEKYMQVKDIEKNEILAIKLNYKKQLHSIFDRFVWR